MSGSFLLPVLAALATLPLALFTLVVVAKLGLVISESNLGLKAMTGNCYRRCQPPSSRYSLNTECALSAKAIELLFNFFRFAR